jgi:DNA-directed RNA polymerase specialized sigma24 family protein
MEGTMEDPEFMGEAARFPGSVTRLAQDLRSPDPAVRDAAAREIWQRYFKALLALARKHLSQRIRRRADEEDVLQSMYKSFVARQQQGDSGRPALADRDELWRLLVTITLRKARNLARYHTRERRDVGRELASTAAAGDEAESPVWDLEQMEAAALTPADGVALAEALERRLAALSDPTLREIALRKLEGYTNREIAAQRGCTERTIERKVERIKGKWGSDQETSD